MANRIVSVPVSVLLDPDLTASAKVLWMASRLRPAVAASELGIHTNLSLRTVRRFPNPGSFRPVPGGPWVKVPEALLFEKAVPPHAKVLYGLIQTLPGLRGNKGHFSYTSLSRLTKISPNTLKVAMAALQKAYWIKLTQPTRLRPLHFTLGSPAVRRALAESALAERRLERAKFAGEAIMQEFLSLLINSKRFIDNARPGFMINPLTGERLEFDRYYEHPARVAFEFHGAQHFGATTKVTQAEAEEQRIRDLIKAGLCFYEGIQLVVVQTRDLSLQGMIKKIGSLLPQRDLEEHEPLIDLLERASMSYQAEASAAARRDAADKT